MNQYEPIYLLIYNNRCLSIHSSYEILFSEVATGNQVMSITSLIDVEWFTWTCTLGWPVAGIWSGSMDGSDVNAVDRSPDGKLLASVDDFGKVNLYKYPAIQKGGSQHNQYIGHSSHVTNVKWLHAISNDAAATSSSRSQVEGTDYLISTGGNDKSVFVWKVDIKTEKRLPSKNTDLSGISSEQEIDESAFKAPAGGGMNLTC